MDRKHIKVRVRKAGAIMTQVWEIGKRKFKTVMRYGAEIWRWEERREVEGMQERYIYIN